MVLASNPAKVVVAWTPPILSWNGRASGELTVAVTPAWVGGFVGPAPRAKMEIVSPGFARTNEAPGIKFGFPMNEEKSGVSATTYCTPPTLNCGVVSSVGETLDRCTVTILLGAGLKT